MGDAIYSKEQGAADGAAVVALVVSHFIDSEKKTDATPGADTALRGKVFSEETWRQISNYSIGVSIGAPALHLVTKDRTEAIFLGEAHLYNTAVVELAKKLIGRERPDGSDNKSFPSLHAAAGILSCTYSTEFAVDHSTALSWTTAGVACATGALAPLARVGAGKHHFTDILVGGAIGAGMATAVYYAHDHDGSNAGARASVPLMLQTSGVF